MFFISGRTLRCNNEALKELGLYQALWPFVIMKEK